MENVIDNKYRLEQKIGSGGTSVVYRAGSFMRMPQALAYLRYNVDNLIKRKPPARFNIFLQGQSIFAGAGARFAY